MRDFHLPGRSITISETAMCATSHSLAAKVALSLMEQGGNAMDAAIGASILLGLCEPQSTAIGGDAFCLFRLPGENRIRALNGSGRAPAGLTGAMLRDQGMTEIPLQSVHAVTIPGAIDAFCRLSTDHGRLDLAQTLAPAIHYAEAGIPVSPRAAFDWENNAKTLQGDGKRQFLLDGKAPRVGQKFRAPEQTETLRRIAKQGRAAFYEGELAEDMVGTLNALGGTHTLDDFAATSADYVDPISGSYKAHDLIEHPPNGQGATAILMANILAHFDVATMDPLGTDRIHLAAEATKLAYDARDRFLADPDHTTRLDHMTSQDTAAQLARLINMERALPDPRAATDAIHKDTVYLTVVDKDRMAVSMIYSIFHAFGSGIAAPKSGVLFQNRGGGFTLEEGHPNEANPGKRPMHTIIPAMLEKPGDFLMPFGVMGGAYQPAGHVHVMSNMIDFGMDPQEALDHPRSFAEAGVLKLERGVPEAVRDQLAQRGHKVVVPDAPLGGGQAIVIDEKDGILIGGSDPRKDGAALGY